MTFEETKEEKSQIGGINIEEDLKEFDNFIRSGRIQELNNLLSHFESGSLQDLFKIIPEPAARIAWALTKVRDSSELASSSLDSKVKEKLESTRSYVLENLANIGKIASLDEYITRKFSSDYEEKMLFAFNEISQIYSTPTWLMSTVGTQPANRILFINRDQKIILDTTADWQDLAFILMRISGILSDDLTRYNAIHSKYQFTLKYSDEKLRNISDYLDNAKEEILSIIDKLGVLSTHKTGDSS